MERIIQASETEFLQLIRLAVREEIKLLSISLENQAIDTPLNITQAAQFLDRPVSTVYSLVSKQEIPHNKKGKRLYFNKSDLIKWVASGKVKTTDEISVLADNISTSRSLKND